MSKWKSKDGRVILFRADCLELLKKKKVNSIDAIVTDPPAGIGFMNKAFDSDRGGRDKWIAWLRTIMVECLRVLKPGGHMLCWSLPRTSHWTATAIEDAGFELRDCVYHIFGSGFPKSLNVSKAIDKAAGAKRKVVGKRKLLGSAQFSEADNGGINDPTRRDGEATIDITAPATDAAKQWDGWGTALKPAVECWWLCRKPLAEKTIAANVLKHGTGGINVDGCRVGLQGNDTSRKPITKPGCKGSGGWKNTSKQTGSMTDDWKKGRFPSHLLLSHAAGCRKRGVKKVKGSPAVSGNEPSVPNDGGITMGKFNSRLPYKPHASPDGIETVEDWQCMDGCSIHSLEKQAGEPVGRFFATMVDNNDSFMCNQGKPESIKGESLCKDDAKSAASFSRHALQTLYAALDVSAPGNVGTSPTENTGELMLGNTTPKKTADITGAGGSKGAASSIGSLNLGGFGNKPKDQFPRGTKSTTKTTTAMTTKSKTSNSLQQDGTTTITSGYEKTTKLLRESKLDGVADAANTNPSIISTPEKQTLTADIVNHVPATTCENGDNATENTITPTIEPITTRAFYCPKASRSERNEGCEGLEAKQQNSDTNIRTYNDRCKTCSKKFVGSEDTICHCPSGEKITDKSVYRNQNNHPTVKSVALMQYLCRLITPPGGIVLDPFMGSGSTGIAAVKEGFRFAGIEMDKEYFEIAIARIKHELKRPKGFDL